MKTHISQPQKFGRRYPWAEWFGRGCFQLVRGRDYTCRTSAMAQLVYQASRPERYNVLVEVCTAEDGQSILVRVKGPRPNGKRKYANRR